jgi:hypothetical protein
MSINLANTNKDNVVEIIRQTNLDDIKDTQTLRSLLKLVQCTSLTDIKSPDPISRAQFVAPHCYVWYRKKSVDRAPWTHGICWCNMELVRTEGNNAKIRSHARLSTQTCHINEIWCRGADELYNPNLK